MGANTTKTLVLEDNKVKFEGIDLSQYVDYKILPEFKNNKELEDIGPICTMAMMGDTNMGGLLVIPVESYEAVLDGERELKRIRKLYNKHINNRNV